ncbi:MAG TPA: hypothetical protein VFA56_12805 [Gaiellaceae bacterium]|nr:hypothetical protein [Gaiellaceae bacterium]
MLATAARFIAFVAVAAAVAVAPASARSSGIAIAFMPKKVVQGEDARVTVSVRPSGSRCTLGVRYQGGTPQPGLPAVVAATGVATWTWQVPSDVQAGPAAATVRCNRAGSVQRRLMIVGRLVEPKIAVLKQGFTTRPSPLQGTRLSYGVILHNDSAKDAKNVSVQVNFVMGDNNLLGTDSQRVDVIGAKSDYALGHMVSFPGAAPITRLEVVVQVEKYEAPVTHNLVLANMHLVPQTFDTKWLGTVEGEMQNTDPSLILQSATLSAVVFDGAGNVLGGGSGFAFQQLPPGTRQFIQLGMGFDPIQFEDAADVMVSVSSSWKPPGS